MKLARRWREILALSGVSAILLLTLSGCERAGEEGPGAFEPVPTSSEDGLEETAAAAAPVEADSDPAAGAEESVAEVAEPVEDEPRAVVSEAEVVPAGAPAESETVPAEPRVPWSLEHAGFAAKLPPDVDFYLDAKNLKPVWELLEAAAGEGAAARMFTGKLGEWAGESGLQNVMEAMKTVVPALLGEEGFVAGRGLSGPANAGLEIYASTNRSTGRALAKSIAEGEFDLFMMDALQSDAWDDVAGWLEKNVKDLPGDKQFAVYAGGRVVAEERAKTHEQLVTLIEKIAEERDELEEARWEADGVTWSGAEYSFKHLPVLQSAFPPESLDVSEEKWAEIQDALQNLSVVVASAVVDEFVVLTAGLGRESVLLAQGPETSLASSESYEFLEEFDANRVIGTSWLSKKLIGSSMKNLLEWNRSIPFTEGMVEGLMDSPKLRRKDEMVKTMRRFVASMKKQTAGTASDHVGALLKGDGLQYETRGGWLGAGLDLESPLKFAKAFSGLGENTFLRAHWQIRPDYVARNHQQVDDALRFLKLMAEEAMERLAEKAEEDEDEEGVVERMARWRRDLVNALEEIRIGYRDQFANALGNEFAMVMDLQGEMIPAVGLDEALVEKGRIPRVALVRPVLKREALSEAWEKWQGALTNMFGVMAEAVEQPIPFPDTMTAEKDDLRTYFFPLPFASDDFLPSVSVSDDLFIMGSSKNLSETLYEATREPAEGEREAGLWVDVNTGALWDFCTLWLDLYEEQQAAEEKDGDDPLEEPEEAEPLIIEPAGVIDLEELDAEVRALEGEVERKRERAAALAQELELELIQLEDGEAPEVEGDIPQVSEDGDEPVLPQAEIENPLLKELGGEAVDPEGGANEHHPEEGVADAEHRHEGELDPEAEAALRAEIEAALEEEMVEQAAAEAAGPFGGLVDAPDPEFLRSLLEKFRRVQGLTYRKWLVDELPRGSLRLKLAPR